MNQLLLRFLAVLLLAAVSLFHVGPAHAAGGITCSSASMTPVSFGTVNPLSSLNTTTATLTYSCRNTDNGNTHSATLCFSIGEPAGAQTSPSRQMISGANKLNFQLYQDSGTTVWGSEFFGSPTPLMVSITLTKGASLTNAVATLYAQVFNGQATTVPGSYTDNYQNGDTAMTVNDVRSNKAPGTCGGTQADVYFPFLVSAVVQKNCAVSANDLTFSAVAAGAPTAPGNTTLSIACTVNTPYTVGLLPLNVVNSTGAGTMKGGSAGNTNTVQYQLYSNSALSQAWGNTAAVGSAGNGVAGSGTGSLQSLNVYAKTTSSTDVTPDTYTDTVQINVNY